METDHDILHENIWSIKWLFNCKCLLIYFDPIQPLPQFLLDTSCNHISRGSIWKVKELMGSRAIKSKLVQDA